MTKAQKAQLGVVMAQVSTLEAEMAVLKRFQRDLKPMGRYVCVNARGEFRSISAGLTRDEVRIALGPTEMAGAYGQVGYWIYPGAPDLHLLFIDGLLVRIATR